MIFFFYVKVVVAELSMEGQKTHRFNQKDLKSSCKVKNGLEQNQG